MKPYFKSSAIVVIGAFIRMAIFWLDNSIKVTWNTVFWLLNVYVIQTSRILKQHYLDITHDILK